MHLAVLQLLKWVDVGDLETVYLRNMPPSPANYAAQGVLDEVFIQ